MPALALAAALASLALSAGGAPGPPAAGDPDAPSPARTALRASLERVVAAGTLATARVGVLVKSLDTGEVLFAHDPDALLNPASNVKLFTSAAALARLGPDFRFETEFRLAPRPAGAPDLHVRGKGDPTLVHERLWAIAGELAHAGVARVH